ncbi:MAG: ATP-binding cassette domain-containing protein [Bacteroidetes bacterium]|nr:ATP-binding cassette domain-containing protein [Bacteroidota bacterium]
MSDIVIKVENLSKQYRLGTVGTGTLAHDLNRWWHLIRGKEDPYLKVGEANRIDSNGSEEYIWALSNINFEVKQGEVLGIIGKNGAGKSTLLKILSRVTMPTTGEVSIKGRIASLLEVGTGFHPELSGRENIFLNGAILGMTKQEIKSKLDEIIEFSGVERYIDTPVKRYSSGMYVRLAFAVAAHLDPEILIVDEVLAVGDAEFQKKCLGKMKDVAGQGRTVLFVSHNMEAISNLCQRTILLKEGNLISDNETDTVIRSYIEVQELNTVYQSKHQPVGNNSIFLERMFISVNGTQNPAKMAFYSKSFDVIMEYIVPHEISHWFVGVSFRTLSDVVAFTTTDFDENPELLGTRKPGKYRSSFTIPAQWLNPGKYKIFIVFINSATKERIDSFDTIGFEIFDDGSPTIKFKMTPVRKGILQPYIKWNVEAVLMP